MDSATRSCAICKKTDVDLKKTCVAPGQASAARPSTTQNAESNSNNSTPRLKNLEKHEPKPSTKLDQGTYLHDRPEKDVFKLLIDAFRLAESDDHDSEGNVAQDSLLSGTQPDSRKPFRQYLKQAAQRNVLPQWWNDEKTRECIQFGLKAPWSNLRFATEKPDIQEHYGDNRMPMQLRMLTEAVRGRGPMGQDGTAMRKLMMSTENGGLRPI
ncbi:hypothetical protein MBLNU457_5147t1 [Dothideomycetes sp. NU457]